jgi:hypothetical protein
MDALAITRECAQPREERLSPRGRAALVLAGAGAAGVAVHALLHDARVGVGWLVVDAMLVAAMLVLLPARGTRPTGAAWLLGAAAVWLGAATVYYASDWVLAVALPANVVALGALALVSSRSMRLGDLGALGRASFDALCASVPASVATAHVPCEALDAGGRRHALGVLRGVLLGLPVAAVFIMLLSAEPNFGASIERALEASGDAASFAAWSLVIGVGLLFAYQTHACARARAEQRAHGVLEAPVDRGPYRVLDAFARERAASAPRGPLVRPLTWAVVLAQLVVVFAGYAFANRAYLFGGDALVTARGTPTYAQYLHRGFEQVSIATLLAVAAVVVGHALLRNPALPRHARVPIPGGAALATIETVLLALVGLALASCWHRLRIYEMAYGHTHLRLAVGFFQLGVAGLLAVTAAKAIARAWRGYASALVLVALGWAVVASSVNADLVVSRGNLERARAGRPLDVDYLLSLSPDARAILHDPIVKARTGTAFAAPGSGVLDPHAGDDVDPRAELRAAWEEQARDFHSHGWRSWRGAAGGW